MAKTKTVFICQSCGHRAHKWIGQCPDCSEWNTHDEELADRIASAPVVVGEAPRPITDIVSVDFEPVATKIGELDRVLGGGIVGGSVTLVGGEPGIGKSTLLLQAAASLAEQGKVCLYVSAEESSEQVRLRAERLGAVVDNLWLVSETSLHAVLAHCDQLSPDFLVVDSIQTVHDPELSSAPGSVGQVRHCAHILVTEAKRRRMSTVLVGHVTKEGGLAGPRALEHVVDTVLGFEGDRHHALRLLRAVKHRYGATDELGVFEMTASGMSRRATRAGCSWLIAPKVLRGRSWFPFSTDTVRCLSKCSHSWRTHRSRRRAARLKASTVGASRSSLRCSSGVRISALLAPTCLPRRLEASRSKSPPLT